jgi:hypothetical protein
MRPSDIEVKRETIALQAQLLEFRFENFRSVTPGPIYGDEILRPRSRDLLRVLAATHMGNLERSRRLLEFFKSGQAIPHEPLSPEQNAVLRALYYATHLDNVFDSIQTGQLTELVNNLLERADENLRMKPRKVGSILTSLGFSNRVRTNLGWVLSLNREDAEKIHELAELYGIEKLDVNCLSLTQYKCDLCKELAARKANRAQSPKDDVKTTYYQIGKDLVPVQK